jgi:hypothetical protein
MATKKLEKDNFDMKMKIFYLEEQLQRYSSEEQVNNASECVSACASEVNELSADNMSLRIKLEETSIELEQRNTLLVKVCTVWQCGSDVYSAVV